MIKFETIVQIHDGHDTQVSTSPYWSGTLYEFWLANPEWTTSEIREIVRNLNSHGFHHIGGGAEGESTIRTATSKKMLIKVDMREWTTILEALDVYQDRLIDDGDPNLLRESEIDVLRTRIKTGEDSQ